MNQNTQNMITIARPNTRLAAALLVLTLLVAGAGVAIYQTTKPQTTEAAAEYLYKSEAQWYNGPVAKPALGGNRMAFVTLWEGAGQFLYVTDLDTEKDHKITLDTPVTGIVEPVVSNSLVAWNDTALNKWQIKDFDLYSYTTRVVSDSVNEVGKPAISGNNIVWREANDDAFSTRLKLYNQTTLETRVLATDKWFTDPVVSGNTIVWLETVAPCSGAQAYRLCVPINAAWNLVAYQIGSDTTKVVKSGIYTKYTPAIDGNQVVWSEMQNGQYDLYRHNLASGSTEQLTNNELEEGFPQVSAGRVAYLGIPQSGAIGLDIAHLLDLNTKVDTTLPHGNFDQAHVTISGDRVAWTEVRDDSRIYIYDLNLTEKYTTVNNSGLPLVGVSNKLMNSNTAKDTDGDGIPDTDETVLFHTNPLAQDSDGDGLSDYQELFIYHSSSTKFDTDGDSYNDGLEVKNNYSPTDPRPIKVSASYFAPTVKVK